jgi:DNA-binding NarL/FixJ family response regulator
VTGEVVAVANGQGRDVVRILLADGRSLFREAVHVALEREADLHVVAEAVNGLHAVAEAERLRPDVVVVQAELPNGDGAMTTRLIRASHPDCRVLLLADAEDERVIGAVLEAGASGYVTKTAPLGDLVAAVRSAHRGESLVSSALLGDLFAELAHRRREQDAAAQRVARLTPREREVLGLLVEGASKDAVAQALLISPQTARTHIQKVIKKLGVHSRMEAALLVTRNGLLDRLRAELSAYASVAPIGGVERQGSTR